MVDLDTEANSLSTSEQLSLRRLHEGDESIDELARDLVD